MDKNQLHEFDLEVLDRQYITKENDLFKVIPSRSDELDYNILPEDDDVFFTKDEEKLLFPHRFGIDPKSIAEERRKFLAPKSRPGFFNRLQHGVERFPYIDQISNRIPKPFDCMLIFLIILGYIIYFLFYKSENKKISF